MPTFDVDVFKAKTMKGKPIAKAMVIIVRCQNPFTDATGRFRPGSQRGIGVWFSKKNYALSGSESATISARTAASHALVNTDPSDWVQTTPKTNVSRDEANIYRSTEGAKCKAAGEVFIGNMFHKLGESLGLAAPKPYSGRRFMTQFKRPEINALILKMIEPAVLTHPGQTLISKLEIKEVVDNCLLTLHGEPLPGNIVTVSDLFAEVTQIVAPRI